MAAGRDCVTLAPSDFPLTLSSLHLFYARIQVQHQREDVVFQLQKPFGGLGGGRAQASHREKGKTFTFRGRELGRSPKEFSRIFGNKRPVGQPLGSKRFIAIPLFDLHAEVL